MSAPARGRPNLASRVKVGNQREALSSLGQIRTPQGVPRCLPPKPYLLQCSQAAFGVRIPPLALPQSRNVAGAHYGKAPPSAPPYLMQPSQELDREEMIFLVGQRGKLRPEAGGAGLVDRTQGPPPRPRRPIRPALPAGPFPGPDPWRCLTDDLSCRQSIGSSSRGERRTKRALWWGRPLPRRAAAGTPSGTPRDAPRPTAV